MAIIDSLGVNSMLTSGTGIYTATQSNSGATVRELSPICIKWFEIFTKIEIKVFQNPKYFNKTIVSTLT